MKILSFLIVLLLIVAGNIREAGSHLLPTIQIDSGYVHVYPWKGTYSANNTLINRIPTPPGYERVHTDSGSFASWLRYIPLKEGRPFVYLYDGSKKPNQQAQYAVIDIDTGDKDLQQCADAVMRLRAEYLYATQQQDKIQFHFTNGFLCDFKKWSEGYRPKVQGNTVTWKKTVLPGGIYPSFRKYMETVFIYSGSQSLSGELTSKDFLAMQPGDVLIHGGSPGHAAIVLDVAQHRQTGEKIFLLAQSYMPAQDMHVLINPANRKLSPWYSTSAGTDLITPEWTFSKTELKGF